MKRKIERKMSYRDLEILIENGQPLESIPVNELKEHVGILIKIDERSSEGEKRLETIRRIVLHYLNKSPEERFEHILYLFSKCASSRNVSIKKEAFQILRSIPKEIYEKNKVLFYTDKIQYSGSDALSLAEDLFIGKKQKNSHEKI